TVEAVERDAADQERRGPARLAVQAQEDRRHAQDQAAHGARLDQREPQSPGRRVVTGQQGYRTSRPLGCRRYRSGGISRRGGADRRREAEVQPGEVGRDDQAAAVEAATVPVQGVLRSRQRAPTTTDPYEQYPASQ